MHRILVIVLIVIWCGPLFAGHLKLIARHGTPTDDRDAGWDSAIRHANWLNEERIVHTIGSDEVRCIDAVSGAVHWQRSLDGELDGELSLFREWSVAWATNRLGFSIYDPDRVTPRQFLILNTQTGRTIAKWKGNELAKRFGRDIGPFALAPNDGSLVVSESHVNGGANLHRLNSKNDQIVSSFRLHPSLDKLTFSSDGRRIGGIAANQFVAVRDVENDKDVFVLGEPVPEGERAQGPGIDAAFLSNLRHAGNHVILTQDHGWTNGKVFVHGIDTGESISFDARNGHIEIAVDFARQRIALTGTSRSLVITDFAGKLIAQSNNVADQRILAVDISPSGRYVVVGGVDTTLSVFELLH